MGGRSRRNKLESQRGPEGPEEPRAERSTRRHRPLVEELEARLLFSADVAPVEAVAPEPAPPAEAVHAEALEALAAGASDPAAAAEEARRELVFVDPGVSGHEALVADLITQREGARFEVIVLDGDRDGVAQIGEVLAGSEPWDAVHVVSHGVDGGVRLGSGWLTNESLAGQRDAIAAWSEGFTNEGDLLFYGCDLAAGEDGRALVAALADLTGADVAASSDDTGAAALGGDWELEVATGAVEAAVAPSAAAQQGWQGLLATELAADDFDAISYAGSDGSLPWTGPWQEVGDSGGAGAGGIRVTSAEGGALRFGWDVTVGAYVMREVDLSGTTSAELHFQFKDYGFDAPDVAIEVRPDAGSSWTRIYTITNASSSYGTFTADISAFRSATTQVRFLADWWGFDTHLYIDNVEILAETGPAATPSAGTAVWSEQGEETPEAAVFDGAGFGATGATADIDGPWVQLAGAQSSVRDEAILAGVDASGEASVQVWNGTSWTSYGDLASGLANDKVGVAVAYEAVSGRAVLVHANGSSGTDGLTYDVWDGSSWAGPTTLTTPLAGEAVHVRLASHPSSDEMVLVVSNQAKEVYAHVWNGSSWDAGTPAGGGGSSVEYRDVHVAYEQQTGHAVVVLADATNAYYRTWDGASWGAGGSIPLPAGASGGVRYAALASDPTSDRIVYGAVTTGNQVWLSVWDGSSWQATELATTSAFPIEPSLAVAFERSTGEALATYGVNGSDFVFYRTWDPARGGSGWSAATLGPYLATSGGNTSSMALFPDPGSDAVMLAVEDTNGDISFAAWDGGSWGSRTQLESSSPTTFGDEPFHFLWGAGVQPPAASTLWLGDTSGQVVSQFDATSLENPSTAGSFSTVVDLASFFPAAFADFESIHYVSEPITLSGIGVSALSLDRGDLILSLDRNGTGLSSTNSLTVDSDDLFVFKPDTPGDYSSGTFEMLAQGIGGANTILAFTLVEQDTAVGGVGTLARGSFLFVVDNGSDDQKIVHYDPTNGNFADVVDAGSGDGFSDAGAKITGIDLVEEKAEIGGRTLTPGQILVAATRNTDVGGPPIATGDEDVFVLDVAAKNDFGATLLFDGSDVGYYNNLNKLTLITQDTVADPPVFTANRLTISEGGTVVLDASDLHASDVDTAASDLTFTVASVSHGQFERVAAPGAAITTFTQAELNAGDIQFVHDGSANAPAYSLTVTDGTTPVGPSAASVSFLPPATAGSLWLKGNGDQVLQEFEATALEDPTTVGSFNPITDLYALVASGDPKFSALHYVSEPIDVGGVGLATAELLRGDLILSVNRDGIGLASTNAIAVDRDDLFVFRPDVAGDYSAGTFTMLAEGLGGGKKVRAVSLVEHDTDVGGAGTLARGSLLLAVDDGDGDRQIVHYDPTDGSRKVVVDGTSAAGFSDGSTKIVGIDLVEETLEIGGRLLTPGQILVTTNKDNDVGSPTISTNDEDVFVLDVTSATDFEASLLFDGSDVGFTGDATLLTLIKQLPPNTAPTLTPSAPSLSGISEDETGNPGEQISDVLGASVSDPDGGAIGVAVTGLVSGNGAWEYDTGSGWTAVGSVSDLSALLLRDTDRIRFVPDGENGESPDPSFSYRAWDRTSGASGTKVDVSTNGDPTAFSTATDTATLAVSSVNDAPTLGDGALAPALEDAANPPGAQVSALFGAGFGDVDAGSSLGGVAVVANAAPAGEGVWEYRSDGGAWFAIGSVDDAGGALALAPDAWIRFVPATDWNGTPTDLVVRGLDDSFAGPFADTGTGEVRQTADTSTPGGSSAIAAATSTLSTSVTPDNDAPVLGNNALTVSEGGTVVLGAANLSATDLDDADAGLVFSVSAVASGQFERTSAPGAAITSFTQAEVTAGDIRFVHDGSETPAAFDVAVSDGSLADGPVAAAITYTGVNDAPDVSNLAGDVLAYFEGSGEVVIEQGLDALVADPDSADFDGGEVRVSITTGGDPSEDKLSIRDQGAGSGQIGYSVGVVRYEGTPIGTVSGGSAGVDLVIDLNAAATPDAVAALLRNVTYENTDTITATLGSRSIEFGVDDGDTGVTSAVATVTVFNVNAPPTIGGITTTQNVDDDTTASPFPSVTISDPDLPGQTLTVRVSLDEAAKGALSNLGGFADQGGGVYEFSGDAAAATTALRNLEFEPTRDRLVPGDSELVVFTLSVDDGIAAPVTDNTTTLTVTSVNDAPTLGNGALAPVMEDTASPPGAQVSALFGAGFADVDASSSLGGVAVVANAAPAGEGVWEYRSDGGAWFAVGGVDDAGNALALAPDAWLRFVPASGWSGTPTDLVLRGLDDTFAGSFADTGAGESRQTVNTSSPGGSSAIAAATSTLSTSVTPDNDAPTLGNNALTVSEGGTVVLGSGDLSATDVDDADPGLVFTISGLSGGQFERVVAPGVAVTSFTQAQVAAGDVRFVHDGGEAAPAYSVTVSDGSLSDGPTAATISFVNQNDAPGIANNALSVVEGGTVVLDPGDLSVGDPDSAPGSLTWTVSGLSGGQFELVAAPGVAVTSFTQAQVAAGDVRFVHDGGESAPAYSVSVSDGALSDGPAAATITFTSQNDAPSLGANALTVTEGGSVVLGAGDLSATDPDDPDASLDFIVSGLSGGHFERKSVPGVPITSFSQAEIAAGEICFVHDGGEAAPAYSVSVTDGSATTGPVAASITFGNQNDAPSIVNNTLTVTEGGFTVLSGADLSATDPDDADPGLTFSISSLTGGQFERVATPGVAITSFSQAEVTAGDIRFVHDGGELAPTWDVTVSDGSLSSSPDTALVLFNGLNDPPVLGNNSLGVAEGGSVVLGTGHLSATDVDDADPSLTFSISALSGGQFELVAAPGVAVTSFTQAQVAAGQVQFVHDGGEAAPAYSVAVSDGALSDGPHAAAISFTNQNDAPTLVNNALTIDEGGSVVLGAADLLATDPDDVDASLAFTVSGVSGGQFERVSAPGVAITSFTQAEVTAGDVRFVDDGDETAPAWSVSVSDGALADGPTPANVTYNPQNDAPTISGVTAVNPVDDDATVKPFAGVVLGDADNPMQILTVDIALDDPAKGVLTNLGPFTHLAPASPGVYRATGNGTMLTLDIRDLVFDPTENRVAPGASETTTFTITVTDGIAGPVSDSTTTVVSTSVNDAPTLAAASPGLPGIDEDATANGGVLVSTLLGADMGDLDVASAQGIAITGLDAGNGRWQIDTGSGWSNLSGASEGSARLLDAGDRIRFVPDGRNADTASFDFRAWDQTAGSAGGTANAGVNGGSSAFSTGTNTASIAVSAVNDAPSMGDAKLASLPDGTADPKGATLASLFGGPFGDVDAGSGLAGVAIVGNAADAAKEGVWEYSSDGGATWAAVGAVSDGSGALAVGAGARVRFVAADGFAGIPAELVVRALDDSFGGGFSSTAGGESRVFVDTTGNGGTSAIAGSTSRLSTSLTTAVFPPPPVDPDVGIDPGDGDGPDTADEGGEEVAADGDEDAPAGDPNVPAPGGEPGDPAGVASGPEAGATPPSGENTLTEAGIGIGPEAAASGRPGASEISRSSLALLRELLAGAAPGLDAGLELSDLIFQDQRADFLGALDDLREEVSTPMQIEARVVGSATAVTTGLSVGYVVWLTRGGLLLASLLSSMPAWRVIDPLPILAGLGGGRDEEDESLDTLIEKGSRANARRARAEAGPDTGDDSPDSST